MREDLVLTGTQRRERRLNANKRRIAEGITASLKCSNPGGVALAYAGVSDANSVTDDAAHFTALFRHMCDMQYGVIYEAYSREPKHLQVRF